MSWVGFPEAELRRSLNADGPPGGHPECGGQLGGREPDRCPERVACEQWSWETAPSALHLRGGAFPCAHLRPQDARACACPRVYARAICLCRAHMCYLCVRVHVSGRL